MKKFIKFLILIVMLGTTYYYRQEINTFYLEHFQSQKKNVTLNDKNQYYKDESYNYVQTTNDFLAKDKQHLLNIYYTIINSGIDHFTFYCSKEYENCLNDVVEIANNKTTLSNINSFVHPFNSFSNIETKYDTLGKITIKVNKSYTEEQINAINDKVDDIINKELKNASEKKEIVKLAHNYIINHSKYDSDKSDKNINNYLSSIAYGPLLQGYGICGGYTDAMAIILDRFSIPNFKIISENHIWNAVKIDGKWYHLDLTWDDPVTSDGSDVLEYNFFLITTKELENLEQTQHVFDQSVFKEMI